MVAYQVTIATALLGYVWCVAARSDVPCDVYAWTTSGVICGLRRHADNGEVYASFRGVPYAKQPLGALRFQELQPPEPWSNVLPTIEEGPICPQHDVFYGKLMQNPHMSEACIHANVHVPLKALPDLAQRQWNATRQIKRVVEDGNGKKKGVPILVFIHGGGFTFGSSDADVYGPEYLIPKGIIVITFNYRLGPFGFLSLNSSSIPGNNGLRDAVTLLRWVRQNAHYFGGDPDEVTLGGQSSGATSAHILTLSPVAEGLFKRAIMMSGASSRTFFTSNPAYASYAATEFLKRLGVNSTDPDEIHQVLIETPLKKIMEAHNYLQDLFGIVVFGPVVESPLPGVKAILTDKPEILMSKGQGANIPLLLGFTTAECETFRPRFEEIDIVARIKENPLISLSSELLFSLPMETNLEIAKLINEKYYHNSLDMDKFIKMCSDSYFVYPMMNLARFRTSYGGAPVYLYQFAYESEYSAIKIANGLSYNGTGHLEDMTYVFKANSVYEHRSQKTKNGQIQMKDLMPKFVTNFMQCSAPTCNEQENHLYHWHSVSHDKPMYENIVTPTFVQQTRPTKEQLDLVQFFNDIYNK